MKETHPHPHPITNGYIHIRDTDEYRFGRAVFILDHPYHYESKDKKLIVDVPDNFKTDFASVPFLFWWFFPPFGKWRKSAIVHDYLYSTGIETRAVADSVFLKECYLAPIRMSIIWAMVRIFGWLFYCRSKIIQKE